MGLSCLVNERECVDMLENNNRERCLLREGPLLVEQFTRLIDNSVLAIYIYIQGRSGRFQPGHRLRVVALIVMDSIHTLQLHGYNAGMVGPCGVRGGGRNHRGS
jgi:hypothetical protein